ncbi:hypothetical protein PYV61_21315, partial [Roseisolibacter sp. H3M3-2]
AAAAAAIAADPTVARLAARVPRPKAGVRRVTVLDLTDGTGRTDLREAAAAVTEGLRRAVAARPEFDMPDAAAARAVQRAGLPVPAVAVATHAGAVVSGVLSMRRDSAAQLLVLAHDAARGYPRQVRAPSPVRAGDDATAVAAALLAAANEAFASALERVKWGEPARQVGPNP